MHGSGRMREKQNRGGASNVAGNDADGSKHARRVKSRVLNFSTRNTRCRQYAPAEWTARLVAHIIPFSTVCFYRGATAGC
jgi:hypothetical protein